MTLAFSRAEILDWNNPLKAKASNRVKVLYRGNRDGKDKTAYFYPPNPS